MLENNHRYDLYILSYGLHPSRDMTLQTFEYLTQCSEVYVMINRQLSAFLESHHIPYTDIAFMYKEGLKREQIYQDIATFIIEQAKQRDNICYLTYGNPMLFDKPCQIILEQAQRLDLAICLVPALSFLDLMLTKLQIPIGTWGLCIYEATRLVWDNIAIDNRIPCFIAQIGGFADLYARGDKLHQPEEFSALIDYLRRFYSSDHLVTLCDSDETGQDLLSCTVPLCLLSLLAPGINAASTLYIPAQSL